MKQHSNWVSVWGNAVSVAENRPERYAKDITIRYPVHIPFSSLLVISSCSSEGINQPLAPDGGQ